MPDKKISDLPVTVAPGVDSATIPVVETVVVGNTVLRANYQSSVRSIVNSALNAGVVSLNSLSDVQVPSQAGGDVLSYQSGSWRPRGEDTLVDGGNW